jgi:hypothetical protein
MICPQDADGKQTLAIWVDMNILNKELQTSDKRCNIEGFHGTEDCSCGLLGCNAV